MIVLDASTLIAHLDPRDVHHPAATAILLEGGPGTFVAHSLTLAEVLVGGVRIGRGMAMRDDLRAAGIRVMPYDADEPLRLAELRATSGLKLPDCCVLDVAVHYRAVLATFDLALAAAACRRAVVVIP